MNFAMIAQSDRVFRTYWAWIDATTKPLPEGASANTIARITRRIGDLENQFRVECFRKRPVL